MQTAQEQSQANALRLHHYLSKLNEQQLTRATIAAAVQSYCRQFNLNKANTYKAILTALALFDCGSSDVTAFNIGRQTARTIAFAESLDTLKQHMSKS